MEKEEEPAKSPLYRFSCRWVGPTVTHQPTLLHKKKKVGGRGTGRNTTSRPTLRKKLKHSNFCSAQNPQLPRRFPSHRLTGRRRSNFFWPKIPTLIRSITRTSRRGHPTDQRLSRAPNFKFEGRRRATDQTGPTGGFWPFATIEADEIMARLHPHRLIQDVERSDSSSYFLHLPRMEVRCVRTGARACVCVWK